MEKIECCQQKTQKKLFKQPTTITEIEQVNQIRQVIEQQQKRKQFNKLPKIIKLRQWLIQKGCIIHPNIQIPSLINNIQGVRSTCSIPAKTLIIAIPSSLILSAQKCYSLPQLKSLFKKNDQLFDYQQGDQAEFNILCVFLMFHKLAKESQWKIYLETIGEPETALDWHTNLYKGLNNSIIEEIVRVRLECDQLRLKLCNYLVTTKQFSQFTLQQLEDCFNYCYRAVMTRCFGYYFDQASLIPIADLINHGCQTVDNQLIHKKYELKIQQNGHYKQKQQKIDLSILGIPKNPLQQLPFRQKFLLSNNLIPNTQQSLQQLSRQKIDQIIYNHNKQVFKNKQIDIEDLEFCQENDQEDNDTDQDQDINQQTQLERLKTQELQQIQNFKKYFQNVQVQKYKDVQDRYDQYQKQLIQQHQTTQSTKQQTTQSITPQTNTSRQNSLIAESLKNEQIPNKQLNPKICEQNDISQQLLNQKFVEQAIFFQKTYQPIPSKGIVPLQLMNDSSSEDQSSDDQAWGLEEGSYFTMSTSSAVAPNKQLLNSYGSRTNKFLLVWYGFAYPNNLYDSVSVRLHVQFLKNLPSASSIVIDTYLGGQGLMSFRKNQSQVIKTSQLSKQFRLKRNSLQLKLLTFLRLFLLDYYHQKDLYKICITIPSSVNFQIYLINYYRQIVMALYQRYSLKVIQELKSDINDQVNFTQKQRQCIRFKIIYLEEQRNILDKHMDTVNCVLRFLNNLKHHKLTIKTEQDIQQKMPRSLYQQFSINQLRRLKPYLMNFKRNYNYVMYDQHESHMKPLDLTETTKSQNSTVLLEVLK